MAARNRTGQAERRAAQREQRRERAEARKRRRRILYMAVSGFVALLVIASFVVAGLPQGAATISASKAPAYVEGVGTQQTIMPSALHTDGVTVAYNTTPPTSGNHWGRTASCGFYEEGITDEIIVHNMEHGQVILSYNLTEAADVERLRQVVNSLRDQQHWLVTRFYPELEPGEVALTVWGILDRFTGIDEDRIKKFFDTYKGNLLSPETQGLGQGIPCTSSAQVLP
ncbi:MAG: DUF3105 domain-containing protein [Chloroflexi bacterium]|nr:DUF3105 domain-containing protein [Chloroflexota bacterium]